MTDHANELRRYSRKIGQPAGDVPSVMRAAADEIERLCAQNASVVDDMNLLRAKITEMEKQEPVAWMLNCQTLGGDTGWILSWTQSGAGLCNRLKGEENEKRLYALPGAQNAPSVPDEEAAYSDWFHGEQSVAYDGMWAFAKAAWMARAALAAPEAKP